MGRIFVVTDDSGKLVITKYGSNGTIIPMGINQDNEITAMITDNWDSDKEEPKELEPDKKAVSRIDFLKALLSNVDCKENYLKYAKGLYSKNDMERGITLGEAAYLLYYVAGLDKTLDWNSIKPENGLGVCVLKEMSGNESRLCEQLAKYKNKKEMEYYIKAMKCGERYIPLPMYCAYVDFLNRDDVDLGFDDSMIFMRLSESNLKVMF